MHLLGHSLLLENGLEAFKNGLTVSFGTEHEVEHAVLCCCHSEVRPWAMPGGGSHRNMGDWMAGQPVAGPFIYFYRKGRGREREGDKHQCLVASHMPHTGDLAYNPGMCPD